MLELPCQVAGEGQPHPAFLPQKSVSGAARDTLQLPALLLVESLGPGHPLLAALESVADANLSSARRREREDRERMHKAELAAQMLGESSLSWCPLSLCWSQL